MKRRLDNRCNWAKCPQIDRCNGCGPMVRVRYLASARPLCHVEMTENNNDLRVYLYDCEDLYPETQRKLETRLICLANGMYELYVLALSYNNSVYRFTTY